MTAEENLNYFISNSFNDIRKKYKQFCFLNGLTYDDDVLHETYLKVRNIIINKGLKDESLKGIESYFFKAFKKNTFLNYQNNMKSKIVSDDDNQVELNNLKYVDDIDNRFESEHFDEFVRNYILNIIQLNFDSLSTRVWRLKRLVTFNNKSLTYEELRKMTHILDCKKRVITIDKWLKSNVSLKDIYTEYSKLS